METHLPSSLAFSLSCWRCNARTKSFSCVPTSSSCSRNRPLPRVIDRDSDETACTSLGEKSCFFTGRTGVRFSARPIVFCTSSSPASPGTSRTSRFSPSKASFKAEKSVREDAVQNSPSRTEDLLAINAESGAGFGSASSTTPRPKSKSKTREERRKEKAKEQREHSRLLSALLDEDDELDVPLGPVVKVYTVSSRPNFKLPWQDKDPVEYTGSGAVICLPDGELRILTNAHVIDGHTFVRIRKQGCPKYYVAHVAAVGIDCDCALLTVEEKDDFFVDVVPLPLSETIPELQEKVMVLGYPTGGDSICCTEGIVSRVELLQYDNPGHEHFTEFRGLQLLCCQIDAAVNNGNSGGPVLNEDNEVVGIVFAGLDSAEAENVG